MNDLELGDSVESTANFITPDPSCLVIILETGLADLIFCFIVFLLLKTSNGIELSDSINTIIPGLFS